MGWTGLSVASPRGKKGVVNFENCGCDESLMDTTLNKDCFEFKTNNQTKYQEKIFKIRCWVTQVWEKISAAVARPLPTVLT